MNTNVFDRKEIESNILAAIKREKRAGTCGMGIDNLRQVTKAPAHGPIGTNASYYYAEEFKLVCESNATIRRFLIR